MLNLRPVLSNLPAYVPGRTVPGAIKLASNESPYPPLPHVLARIAEVAAGINRYPDANATELTAALAGRHRVDPDRVAPGCGSVAVYTQLVQAVADADDEVVYAWRSFEAYPIIAAVAGASSVQVPLSGDHRHDLDAMADAITGKTRLVTVCNPNNPTGTVVDERELRAFLDRVPSDTVVALDEAYREYISDPAVPDGIGLLADYPNLVVLRTFSKAYGLAGLRVGYAVAADPALARAIKQTQVPFALTAVAQQAAMASLEPQAERELLDRVAVTVAERGRVHTALTELGYPVPASQANFVWFPLGEATVDWAAAMDSHRVIGRPFAGAGVRVTISTPEENDLMIAAARECHSLAGLG